MSDTDDSDYGDNDDVLDIIDEISEYEYYQLGMDLGVDISDERKDGNYYIGCYSYTSDCYLNIPDEFTNRLINTSGLFFRLETTPKLLFGECIHAKTFFHFDFADIVRFLNYCNRPIHPNPTESVLPLENKSRVHILQLCIEPVQITQDYIAEQYLCVLKTHWISLVQRHWKRVFLARKKYVDYYRNPKHLYSRELGSRLGLGPKVSGLRGMLACYSSKK